VADTRIVITAATGQAEKAMQSLGSAAGTLASKLHGLPSTVAAFAPAAALAGMAALGKGAVDAADNLNDLSQKFDLGIKELTSYQLIAEQSGTSLDGVAAGLKKLSSNLVENGGALKAAGIDTRNTSTAMRDIAELFARMPDGAEKTALAIKLFGKAGSDLIPMLNAGAAGLDRSALATARLGELYEKLAPQADELNDSWSELMTYAKGIGVNLANFAVPALLDFVKAITAAIQAGQSFGTTFNRALGTETLERSVSKTADEIKRVQGLIAGLESRPGTQNAGRLGQLQNYLKELQAKEQANLKELQIVQQRQQAALAPAATDADRAKGKAQGKGLLDRLGGSDSESAKAAKAALKEQQDQSKAWVESIDAQIQAEKELAEATARSATARYEEIQQFKKLADPAAEYREQLEKLAELRARINAGEQVGISATEVDKATEAIKEQERALDKTTDVAKDLGLTFTSAFEAAIAGGKGFRDILEGILQDLVKLAARKTVTEPLLKALGSLTPQGTSFFQSFMPSTPDGSSNVDLGGSLQDYLGSFAVGHPNIPRDGFAMLHKGERVMTAAENRAFMSLGGTPNVSINVTNNVSGAEVSTGQARMGPSGLELEVMIDKAVATRAATPGSAMDRTLTGRGARSPLVQR
jgi:hypothetical protein